MVLIVIDFAHVVVDFATLIGRNVCCGIISFMNKLLEQGVHLTVEALSIERTLHTNGFQFVKEWLMMICSAITSDNVTTADGL